jgi:glycosyltransferase involved in cell wall biosynthesis
MTMPFFSVITSTHLRAGLLRRALQSLRAQSFQDFDIIVVADAMDADTGTVAAELLRDRDTFLKRSGKPGPAASRNMGMQLARGEWVVFLDDDDTFRPHHLQAMHAHALQNGAPVLYSDYEVITEDRAQPGIAPLGLGPIALSGFAPESLHVKNFIPNNVLAYKRGVLDGVTVDPHLASQEDWDFLLGVCAKAMPVYVPGGGAVVHKDYVNQGTRRGTQASSNDSNVLADFRHLYRRGPAPTPELQQQRQLLLKSAGLDLPASWF